MELGILSVLHSASHFMQKDFFQNFSDNLTLMFISSEKLGNLRPYFFNEMNGTWKRGKRLHSP